MPSLPLMIPLNHSFLLIVWMTFFVFLRNGDISHKLVGFTNLCVMEVFRETLKKNVDDISKVIKGQSRITVRYWILYILSYLRIPLWESALKIYTKYTYCCVLSSKNALVASSGWVMHAEIRWFEVVLYLSRIDSEIRSKRLTWLVVYWQKTWTLSCTLEILTCPGIDNCSKMARCHFHPHPRFMSYDYELE